MIGVTAPRAPKLGSEYGFPDLPRVGRDEAGVRARFFRFSAGFAASAADQIALVFQQKGVPCPLFRTPVSRIRDMKWGRP
jgi:hypothetical protein